MNIKIYDYEDNEKVIELPDKEIKQILVTILAGDEVGRVEFMDNTMIGFDASDCRVMDYFDGSYVVEAKDVNRWNNFEFPEHRTKSYARYECFSGESFLR